MSYALKVARSHKGKVCMICKTSLDEANTSFAQGGVASVTNLEVDNFDKHIQDTLFLSWFLLILFDVNLLCHGNVKRQNCIGKCLKLVCCITDIKTVH